MWDCSANRWFLPAKMPIHSLKMALFVCNRQITNELPTPDQGKGGVTHLAAPSLRRPAMPGRPLPRPTESGPARPGLACLAMPRLAYPRHAQPRPASPGRACLALPRRAKPCPARPCRANQRQQSASRVGRSQRP
jgi:hypothetical protein